MLIISAALICCIIAQAGAQPQAKTAEKAEVFAGVDLASQHCRQVAKLVPQPYDAFAYYKSGSEAGANFPDFTFLLGEYQTVIDRKSRIKFNALQALEVLESLGFSAKDYPFAGNCQVQDFTPNPTKISLNTILAFGTKQHKISYEIQRQKGYSWQITDFAIDGKSLAKLHREAYSQQIETHGFANFIENLCNSSSFANLGCK